jgi:hypothetical protein
MRAARNILSQLSLTTLYYSLIHSHLIYAIHVWSCTSPSIVNELHVKQKMVIRIFHNSKYNAHTESLFKKSSILPLPSFAEYLKIQFMHQHYFKQLPASFGSTWSTNAERRNDAHHIALRNDEDYYDPLSRLSSTDNHPLVYFPKILYEIYMCILWYLQKYTFLFLFYSYSLYLYFFSQILFSPLQMHEILF